MGSTMGRASRGGDSRERLRLPVCSERAPEAVLFCSRIRPNLLQLLPYDARSAKRDCTKFRSLHSDWLILRESSTQSQYAEPPR